MKKISTISKAAIALLLGGTAFAANAQSVSSVYPSPGTVFNYTQMSEIQITASSGITSFGSVSVKYNNSSASVSDAVLQGPEGNQFLQIGGASAPNFKSLMSTIANSGADSFTVEIEGIQTDNGAVSSSSVSGVSVTNGVVSFSYQITPAPDYLPASSTWPSTFLNYWAPGDKAGIATLAFSDNIAKVDHVIVYMGRIDPTSEAGTDFTQYEVTPSVSGKTVTIDFTGVERASNQSQVTVEVGPVFAANGLEVEFDSPRPSLLYQYISYSATGSAPETPENPGDDNNGDNNGGDDNNGDNNGGSDQPGNTPGGDDEPGTGDQPNQPTPDITYMSEPATLINSTITAEDAVVELTWPATVSIVDAETLSIPVTYNGKGIGSLKATYVNLVAAGESEPDIDPMAETGDEGSVMYLLLGAADMLQGAGEYTLTLPAGMVEDAAGAYNKQQTVTVTLVASVEGVVTPEDGTEFELGENVVITITYPSAVTVSESVDAPVILTDYAEYDEQLAWEEDVVYVEGNAVVINLGELEAGTYYLSFRAGAVLVNGAPNAGVEDYSFVVLEGETDGIHAIGAELNGEEAIYNLNGVKVSKDNLGKGIYIINGKKVILK